MYVIFLIFIFSRARRLKRPGRGVDCGRGEPVRTGAGIRKEAEERRCRAVVEQPMSLLLRDYDYALPEGLIAARPLAGPRRLSNDGAPSRFAPDRAPAVCGVPRFS